MIQYTPRVSSDPVIVERTMVEQVSFPSGWIHRPGRLALWKGPFAEHDPRKWALWRISVVRQFQPAVLKRLPDDDLLFLAGQSPEGYTGVEAFGVQVDRHKLAQNALRARVELDNRATRGNWWRTGRSTLKWPHCSPLTWPHLGPGAVGL
jgi:hypothetical protein